MHSRVPIWDEIVWMDIECRCFRPATLIRRWAGCEDPRQPRKTITRTKTSSMSPSTSTSTTRTRTKMIWKPFRCQATSLSPSSALWRLRLPKRPDCHYETEKIYLKFEVQKSSPQNWGIWKLYLKSANKRKGGAPGLILISILKTPIRNWLIGSQIQSINS